MTFLTKGRDYTIFPESVIITFENLDSINFNKVIYAEFSPVGAMGNSGGIVLYVQESEDKLVTYETNSELDAQIFDNVSERIRQRENFFACHYGGVGNNVYIKKDIRLEIDKENMCFWYHTQNTKLRIDSSVVGVFLGVVYDIENPA